MHFVHLLLWGGGGGGGDFVAVLKGGDRISFTENWLVLLAENLLLATI